MDENWRNTFGILMCLEICDGTGTRICDGAPSTCSGFAMRWLIGEGSPTEKSMYTNIFLISQRNTSNEYPYVLMEK